MSRPETFIADTPDTPDTFEPDKKSHGATGSWTAMGPVESAARSVANFGKAAYDTVVGGATGLVNAATTPQTEDEKKLPFIGLAAKRIIKEPTEENVVNLQDRLRQANAAGMAGDKASRDQLAKEAMYYAVGVVPLLGPIAQSVMDRISNHDYSGALGELTGLALAPKATEEVAGAIGKTAGDIPKPPRLRYAQERPLLMTTPEGHLRNALKPELDDAGIKLAGEQLKAGESKIGKPVKDVDTAKEAAKAQFRQELMPQRRAIIDPQKDVTVPGSRRRLINAKIDAIPADIMVGTPEYNALVERAKSSVTNDLTIGELEELNSSLNSQTSSYHKAKLSTALTKEESVKTAMDIGAERESRALMEDGMQAHGLGGYDALKEVNKRIGTVIKLEDAIKGAESQARVEATMPRFRRLTKRGQGTTINEGIANAMRKWESTSEPIDSGVQMWGPSSRTKLLPASTSIDLGPAPDTSSVTGEAATPAKGPFTGKPIKGKQQPLQPTVIKQGNQAGQPATPIFGMRQEAGEIVPAGSKLSFKSKLLDGTDQWHYEMPDGRLITLDHELTPEFTKQQPAAPYEAGSSHAGNPYSEPTPPPRKRTKRKL